MEAITSNKVVSNHAVQKSSQSVINKHSDFKSTSEKQYKENVSEISYKLGFDNTRKIIEHRSKSKTSIIEEGIKESEVSGVKF